MTNRTTFLGTGAMGAALATASIDAGRLTVVWNRTPTRTRDLAGRGATPADTVEQAVNGSGVIVVCLYDYQSVHDVLDPVADRLGGRTLINLTTTTPTQARQLAAWAAEHDIDYLDGGIMATPPMVGKPEMGSAIFYSGSSSAYEENRALLELWGDSPYFGEDAGMASLYDLAMLSGMYVMFAGFMHGAAMVGSEGVSATEFAARQTTFLTAMAGSFASIAEIIDDRNYEGPGQQTLEFTEPVFSHIVQASTEQGVPVDIVQPVHDLFRRQIDKGYGKQGTDRIFEELRSKR